VAEGNELRGGGFPTGGIVSGDVGGGAELAARVAAQAAFCGLGVSLDRLYDDADRAYRVFVRATLRFLDELNREEAERNKS